MFSAFAWKSRNLSTKQQSHTNKKIINKWLIAVLIAEGLQHVFIVQIHFKLMQSSANWMEGLRTTRGVTLWGSSKGDGRHIRWCSSRRSSSCTHSTSFGRETWKWRWCPQSLSYASYLWRWLHSSTRRTGRGPTRYSRSSCRLRRCNRTVGSARICMKKEGNRKRTSMIFGLSSSLQRSQ